MDQALRRVLKPRTGRCFSNGNMLAGGLLLLLVMSVLPGCSRMMASAANDLAGNLSAAIANHDDPATVKAGGPAYLLMLDGMIHSDPQNEALLLKGASLYSTYASAFVDDPERARKLSVKALAYAERALCVQAPDHCHLRDIPFDVFQGHLQDIGPDDVPLFYSLGSAWAGWIQAHKDDLEAVAEISRVEAVMERIIALEEGYREGGAHVYMGVFAILVPPALGGQPAVAREHFERAISLSGGRNLMTKVIYAQQYARMIYDRELHDRLLQEVLAADPRVPGLVLENTLAQERARVLMAEADAYF